MAISAVVAGLVLTAAALHVPVLLDGAGRHRRARRRRLAPAVTGYLRVTAPGGGRTASAARTALDSIGRGRGLGRGDNAGGARSCYRSSAQR